MDNENKESCESKKFSCCSSCCCGMKKLFLGLLLGIILASLSIAFFAAGKCMAYKGGICSFTDVQR